MVRLVQLANMSFIYQTLEVFHPEMSRDVRPEQFENIYCVSASLAVLNPERSSEVKFAQPLNM